MLSIFAITITIIIIILTQGKGKSFIGGLYALTFSIHATFHSI